MEGDFEINKSLIEWLAYTLVILDMILFFVVC